MRRSTCLPIALLAAALALTVGCGPAESHAVPDSSPEEGPKGDAAGPPPPPKIIVDPNAPDPNPLANVEAGGEKTVTLLRHWILVQENGTGMRKARKDGTWVDGSKRRMNKHYVGNIEEFKGEVGGAYTDIDEMEVKMTSRGQTYTILAKREVRGNSQNDRIEWWFDLIKANGVAPGHEEELPAEFDGTMVCPSAGTTECLNVKLRGTSTWTKATKAHILMKR